MAVGTTAATSGIDDLGEFRRLFSAAHGEVGFAAAFAAYFSGKLSHNLTGLVTRFDRCGRTKDNEAGPFAERGAQGDDSLPEFV